MTAINRALLGLEILGRWEKYNHPTAAGEVGGSNAVADVLDLPGKIWALPNTVIGLAIGVAGMPFGAYPTIANNAIQFRHFPVGDGVLTLGNVSIYGPGWTPDSSCDCYGNGDTNTAAHQREHTYQYQALGPLFLPVYFLFGGGIQSGNFMENDADHYSLGSTDWFRNAPTH